MFLENNCFYFPLNLFWVWNSTHVFRKRYNIKLLAGPEVTWGWGSWLGAQPGDSNSVDTYLRDCTQVISLSVFPVHHSPLSLSFYLSIPSSQELLIVFCKTHLAAGKKSTIPCCWNSTQHNTSTSSIFNSFPSHMSLLELNFSYVLKSLAVSNTGLNANIAKHVIKYWINATKVKMNLQ